LKPSILTITEGWDSGYGLFVQGEAPMVLSYTTSPAYHAEYENSQRYKATIFETGNYMQIEGMGIIKGAPHGDAAKLFMDFMLTKDFQEIIPLTNWMFPVNPQVALPDSFQFALKPQVSFMMDSDTIDNNYERWIVNWVEVVGR
jgi:thiamine transport system substrate-binding protein